ncbi:uncharacterized protein LOC114521149 [Dendronephthya gigantea]|uniref:uncharacterized protein LOC114521149 n=1 Tax=Dendronephthya gigantea TaxID=151771 RepID=UPI00106DB977|nr:uncharacterized protein LOC114521149 [Dendronephthya gigantea]XP_028397361.1 uncharacterized protein LOC114521149 [Dendronephthya gigantea]XP_028397363.1 uncharacterized protein LOC114521149 [Dendronephthya gigantea]XP_028397364.1 uncharacterized protein LOC114521149 [Dendronephthya gigantea]
MSSGFAIRITLMSAILWSGNLVSLASDDEGIDDHYSGECVNRENKSYPTAECKKYLKCSPQGHASIESCENGKIYNINTNTCEDPTSTCNDTLKVNFSNWGNLNDEDRENLKNGIPPPMTATFHKGLKNFGDYPKKILSNQKVNILLETRFLSVVDGEYMFTSKCVSWCKLWIRRVESGICGPLELVLHQKPIQSEQGTVGYYLQKNVTLEFGTFYDMIIVHISEGKYPTFKMGVQWWHKDTLEKKSKEEIPSIFLRLPRIKKCPKQSLKNVSSTTYFINPSPTGEHRPTATKVQTSTGLTTTNILASTLKFGASTSTPNGQPTRQSSVQIKPTPTRKYSPASSSIKMKTSPLPKTDVKKLANMMEKYLSSHNQTNNNDSSLQVQSGGLSQARQVEFEGVKIAENWNKPGESETVQHTNVVMEVNFPLSNYTFPRNESNNRIRKEFQSDQIFIPSKALVNNNGEFKRKVFSALYFNLDTKLPQYFNEVETETNRILGSYQLNSRVIACTAVPPISGLPNYDIVIRLSHLRANFSLGVKPMCAFFKWKSEIDSTGIWSTEGCILDEKLSNENMSVCRCNHLTHFGILMQVDETMLGKNDVKALKLITYIGCALSLIGACLTVLAIMCLPGARSERNFIHVNLAVAIGLAQVTFLAGIDETDYKVACIIVAALLHYFLLVAFSWMLVEGIFLHILIVKVFHDQLPKRRFYVTFCWGLPFVIVLLSVNLLRDGYGTETSCWLSTDKSTIWTFSGPAILVMIINIIILCKVMKEINSLRTSDQRDSNVRSIRYGVRSTIILLPLLGLTWAFGLICVNDDLIVFQYLFTIFNSLQGLFIFLFHCVFNTEVRKAFWRKVDLWFTTHNNPFGTNGHSRSSFKKSKDEPSSISSPEKEKKEPSKNGLSMYSFNDLTERERRKLSSTTASTCLDPWPLKLSIASSVENGTYPPRYTPSFSSDDIKYQAIYKHDISQNKISHKDIQVEDLNGNSHTMNCDSDPSNRLSQTSDSKTAHNGSKSENINRTSAIQNGNAECPILEVTEQPFDSLKQQNENKNCENSGQTIENPKECEVNYIQKEPQTNCDVTSNPNKTVFNNTQDPSRNSSRESLKEEFTVGIGGGQPTKSGETVRHVMVIDVNSSPYKFLGNRGTKL